MNPSKMNLETLFDKKAPESPDAAAGKKLPPMRPCGCRTWFVGKEVCPYCGKRILKAVLGRKFRNEAAD